MKLKISTIADIGDADKERVVLKANDDFDLTHYAVFGCHKAGAGFQGGNVPHAYWFWAKDIKKDDFVVLYTKAGTPSVKENKDGTKSYFFYWHKPSPIWNGNLKAVVVNTLSWSSSY